MSKVKANQVIEELAKHANKERAEVSQRFFKTGPGQYGQGDVFLGLSVPLQRKIAKQNKALPLSDLKKLLASKIHEHRFTALEILVMRYEDGSEANQKEVADFYQKNLKYVNNWDLVDTSAPYILGDHLLRKDKSALYKLARSKSLWDRRVAIISTFAFIKTGKYQDALKISEILLNDSHDLIQKAVGWMLREVGNRSLSTEVKFLKKHYKNMPRTMLRYAIEKFPETERRKYLKGLV